MCAKEREKEVGVTGIRGGAVGEEIRVLLKRSRVLGRRGGGV